MINYYVCRTHVISFVKSILGIENFTVFVRKKINMFEKLFYHKKYNVQDVINTMKSLGLKPGDTIVIHSSMSSFYNFQGSALELIQALIDYLGEDGTLCMPSYPVNRTDPNVIFDLVNDKTGAGYLAETFRNYPGVIRSVNKLHSVCAFGKNAVFLCNEHHLSKICYDDKSPYYKLGLVNGKSFSIGLPKYFIGTISHVSEALLVDDLPYFKNKFMIENEYVYRLPNGEIYKHKMLSDSNYYIRAKNNNLVDTYFKKGTYGRKKLSNMWINMYDVKYSIDRFKDLALQGKTIYKNPKFFK